MDLTLEQFTQQLVDSNLMSNTDVAEFVASWNAGQSLDSGDELARLLIKQSKLTPYQVQQIGHGKGSTLVLGNYTILDKLGQGGMGMVLKAEHRRMKRVVALKVLSPAVTENPEMTRRFQREVEAAARLDHPNIVTAYDADEANGTHFLVMQFVEGCDLSVIVLSHGPLPIKHALACTLQAARGLEYAHRQGVIHRDIKPANLLLDLQGCVKILDMGLARLEAGGAVQDQLTGTGQIMGTVDFMAPEQAMDSKTADARADIYSLGATLWYLLTGRVLYEGDTIVKKLMGHQNGVIPSLLGFLPDAASELETLFKKMVAKDPQARYQNMSQVIDALQSCTAYSNSTPSMTETEKNDQLMDYALRVSGTNRTSEFETQVGSPGQGTNGPTDDTFATLPRHPIVERREAFLNSEPDSSATVQFVPGGPSTQLKATQVSPTEQKTFAQRWHLTWAYWALAATTLSCVVYIITRVADSRSRITEFQITDDSSNKLNSKHIDESSDDSLVSPEPRSVRRDVPRPAEKILGNAKSLVKKGLQSKTGRINPGPLAAVVPMMPNPRGATDLPAAPLKLPESPTNIALQQVAWARQLSRPAVARNSLQMSFAMVPPGEFEMGEIAATRSDESSKDGAEPSQTNAFDKLRHRIKITRPFAIGQNEVTIGQFRQFVLATHYKTRAELETATGVSLGEGLHQKKRSRQPNYSWKFAGEFPLDDEQPATNLSWHDALAFSEWLSQKEGLTYRLPTEAEWEYVARAGNGLVAAGSQELLELIKQQANLADVSGMRELGHSGFVTKSVNWDDTFAALAAVGRFSPNALGLQDLYGNVAEWCSDRYGLDYYQNSPLMDPGGPDTGTFRVIRGASWQSTVADCDPGARYFAPPHQTQLNVGFRLVQELPVSTEERGSNATEYPATRELRIAHWVLKSGGKVRVAVNREPAKDILQISELPKASASNYYTVYGVDLSDTGVSDLGLSRLKSLTSLQELNLTNTPITDSGIELLAPLRDLNKLVLSRTQITGAGLKHLVTHQKLSELDLSGCSFTDSTIAPIYGLKNVAVLKLNATAITDKTLQMLKFLPALRELSLVDTRITGTGLVHLKDLTNLALLDLSQTPLNNEQLTGLKELHAVRQLRFSWSMINDLGLQNLKENDRLTHVELRGTEAGDSAAAFLEELKGIQMLDLRETNLTVARASALQDRLKAKIEFAPGDIDDRVASLCLSVGGQIVISEGENGAPQTVEDSDSLPDNSFKILEIDLTNLPVSNGVLWKVPELTDLKVIHLDGTNIDDAGVKVLSRASKLQSLSLEGTRITEDALKIISDIKTLKKLSVRNNRITDDKVIELRGKLPGVEIP